jgi:hypothetical protein
MGKTNPTDWRKKLPNKKEAILLILKRSILPLLYEKVHHNRQE